jgi:hypothetical protein
MTYKILTTITVKNSISEQHLDMLMTDISVQCESLVDGTYGYEEDTEVLDYVTKLVGVTA